MSPALLLIAALASTAGTAVSGVDRASALAPSSFEDAGASASGRVLSPVGLFPIWENTGTVLGHAHYYVGSNLLGVGIGSVQLGTHPLRDLLKTPNLQVKVQLLEFPQLQLAAHLEVLRMEEGASEAFTVSNFVSRWSTEEAAYWVAPLGVSGSWAPRRDLFFHLTLTAQGVASSELPGPQMTVGLAGQVEWRPFEHHAFALHAAEVGFLPHDFWQVGASYRYQRWIFEGSIGCAVQTTPDGTLPPFPAVALGISP